jgi:putative two-component system response regulator
MFTQTIGALAEAVDKRDPFTARHSQNVKEIAVYIGRVMRVNDAELEALEWGGLLHDVGKIGVPDQILLKPGPLTSAEILAMQRHAKIGYDILSGSGLDLLDLAATIAWTHHERVDGAGYPRGLAGSEIPLEGRIVAVVDVYDALTSDRPYRPGLSHDDALTLMGEGSGTHFDSIVLDAFMQAVEDSAVRREAAVA